MITQRDLRYFGLAQHVAQWSKDPTTKVGAVLVGIDRREVSLGYNGFPPLIEDRLDRLNDRETKHKLTMHAERNLLDNTRFCVVGASLYVTFFPCIECAKSIASRGIKRVVCPPPSTRLPWCLDNPWAILIMEESGITIENIEQGVSDAEAGK